MTSRADAARDILSIPLFAELMAGLETAAVNAAVYAKLTDDAARQANLAEVRAIRSVMSRIESIAKEGDEQPVRRAPA